MTQVLSFGCRLNIAESAVLAGLVDDSGLVIVNSCAVTAEAVRTGAQAARRAARGGARVVVTGCAAEVEAGAFAGFATVGRAGKFEAAAYFPLPPGERSEPRAGRAGVGASPQAQAVARQRAPTPTLPALRFAGGEGAESKQDHAATSLCPYSASSVGGPS